MCGGDESSTDSSISAKFREEGWICLVGIPGIVRATVGLRKSSSECAITVPRLLEMARRMVVVLTRLIKPVACNRSLVESLE